MKWVSILAGARGTHHRATGDHYEDCGRAIHAAPGVLVGAVADGAGSAAFSARGARLAVQTALRYLRDSPEDWGKISASDGKARLLSALRLAQRRLLAYSDDRGIKPRDLACTFILFIAAPSRLLALQVGDGFLVVKWEGASEYSLLFPPTHGECVNETAFITDPRADLDAQTTVVEVPAQFLCASTDGLEPLAIRYCDQKPHAPFFRSFEEFAREAKQPRRARRILHDFLTSERVNARVTDDKTLLLAVRTAGEAIV